MLDVERWALDVYPVKSTPPRRLIDPGKLLRDFPSSRRYLIGVSGGRDSIALLHLLVDLGYNKLVVCHLNHQLRGHESREDARFVEKIGGDLQLDCEIGATDVGALARRSKLSIETAARFARFAFFVEAARRRRCSRIFLAHHADDLVETALLNLFRGASPGGMAALRKISVHRIGQTRLTILRPLLEVWRSEINSYIEHRGLKYCEDKTNREVHSSRNRIRHRILPYINKTFGRDVSKVIWRAAVIWEDEESFLDAMTPVVGPRLSVAELRKLAVPLQRRAIVGWLRLSRVPNAGFDLVENVRSLLEPTSSSSKINVPGDRHVRRRAKTIFIEG